MIRFNNHFFKKNNIVYGMKKRMTHTNLHGFCLRIAIISSPFDKIFSLIIGCLNMSNNVASNCKATIFGSHTFERSDSLFFCRRQVVLMQIFGRKEEEWFSKELFPDERLQEDFSVQFSYGLLSPKDRSRLCR